MEYLDIVDENGNVTGKATRDECHSNPKLIHPVMHCWIFNSEGKVLIQKRSKHKKINPGMWDISCAGHISSGENAGEALMREIEEELGLKEAKVNFVSKYIHSKEYETEFIYLYYVKLDQNDFEIKLQEEEVEEVKWVNIDEAIRRYVHQPETFTEHIVKQIPMILQHLLISL